MAEIEANQNQAKKRIEAELKKLKKELDKITQGIEIMESHIPDAMLGDYALTVEELANAIRKQKEKAQAQKELISEKEEALKQSTVSTGEWEELKKQIPTWQQVFENADKQTQRVLVNKLIERIDVTDEQIVVRFKISLEDFLPRISGDSPTILYTPGSA